MNRSLRSQSNPSILKSVPIQPLLLTGVSSILLFGSCAAMLHGALSLTVRPAHSSIARSSHCERGSLRFIPSLPTTVIRVADDQRGGF